MPAASLPVYVTIDFETSDYSRDSACAVDMAKLQDAVIVFNHHHAGEDTIATAKVFAYLQGSTTVAPRQGNGLCRVSH